MNKLKLYFSCALTGLPEEHRQDMVALREHFKFQFDVFEFCPADTPMNEIYRHDIHVCVAQCDLMLAICDERSTGLGYELGCAIEKHNKPVLAVVQTGNESVVSKLIQGIEHPRFKFQSYVSVSDIFDMLIHFKNMTFPFNRWK